VKSWEREDEYIRVDDRWAVKCGACGAVYFEGDSFLCESRSNPDGHSRPLEHHPFIPYMDYHISRDGKPKWIGSQADLWREKRLNKVDYPDEKFARAHKERVERVRDERGY
jgi:hypothetical protein